ncbi:hypothetical protein M513_13389 [Trichuris suis]|uniref:Uncharacterized protein n=1 Tax=Trichuris suis TaxID=68888 RepID=A0A085LL84_9BILA|nr:hypothetical protein M513_13389 [Trichuris suis]
MQDALVVEELMTCVDAVAVKARSVQEELESLLSEEHVEQEVNVYMILERDIRALRVEARQYIEKSKEQTSSVKEVHNGGACAPVLPKWDLPKFNGDVLLFTAFWTSLKLVFIQDQTQVTSRNSCT